MTQEQRQFWRDAWFPVGLFIIGACCLAVHGLVQVIPYVVTAIGAAFE